MTLKVMNNLYKELEEKGITFIQYGWRFLDKRYNGADDFVSWGILRNTDKGEDTMRTLKTCMTIAKRKKTYVIEVRDPKEISDLQKNDIVICFVQKGLFQAISEARLPVVDSLQRSFWYYQEDEKALALGVTLKRLQDEMVLFDSRANDLYLLNQNSIHFRRFIKREADVFLNLDEMMNYMENAAYRKRAETLCLALIALQLIC